MSHVVTYPLESGGTVLVTVEGPAEERVVTRGWGEGRAGRVTQQAEESFESAVARIRPTANALLSSLADLDPTPTEIDVEFAVQLTAEAGVCIATLGSTANFKIALRWTPQKKVQHQH